MTDVSKNNTVKISNAQDARRLYAFANTTDTGKIGLEVEMALYKTNGTEISIPTPGEMSDLQAKLRNKGFDAQLEAAGVLEYASPAVVIKDAAVLAERVRADLAEFTQAAKEQGLTRAPYSILPTTTRAEAFSKMASRERLVTSINAMLDIFPAPTVEIPLLTAGVQTSFSPKDEDQLFRMVYRAYALTPLLMAAMNSSSGFVGGDPARKDMLYRNSLYLGYGAAGGISPAFLKSSNGAEFIGNHIEAVFDAPLHFAYGKEGALISASKENPLTFRGLIAQGLNTQSNYELAESFLYNDVKICNLRDKTGSVIGKRMEVRAADSGQDQPVMAFLLTAALVPDGPVAAQFDTLLKEYGFTGDPKEDADLFVAARNAAVNHNGKFMDVAFGTGNLLAFARDVAVLLSAQEKNLMQVPEAGRLLFILTTGSCDAAFFAAARPDFQAVKTDLLVTASAPEKPLKTVIAAKTAKI